MPPMKVAWTRSLPHVMLVAGAQRHMLCLAVHLYCLVCACVRESGGILLDTSLLVL